MSAACVTCELSISLCANEKVRCLNESHLERVEKKGLTSLGIECQVESGRVQTQRGRTAALILFDQQIKKIKKKNLSFETRFVRAF